MRNHSAIRCLFGCRPYLPHMEPWYVAPVGEAQSKIFIALKNL